MDLLQCKLPAKADEESSYGERFGATLDQVQGEDNYRDKVRACSKGSQN